MITLTYRKQLEWLTCRVFFFLTTVISSGCDDLIADAVWIQERSIVVNTANIEQCLLSALTEVPNVEIDQVSSIPGDIILNVKFENPVPSLSVHVRNSDAKKIRIMFIGKGTVELEDCRKAITPMLTSISNNIAHKCSTYHNQG